MKFYSFRSRYFDGYSRKIVLDKKENARVEYVYEGIYHIAECSGAQWRLHKAVLLLFALLGDILLIFSMSAYVPANFCSDVLLLQVSVLFLLFANTLGAISRLSCGRKLTKWEYRMGVKTISECSLLSFFVLLALLLDEGGSFLTGRWSFDADALTAFFPLVFLAVLQLSCVFLVKKETYREEISNDLPHGIDITNDF